MDKFGRPDINTGLGLMRGIMDIKTFQNRQQDRALGLKDRKAFDSALGMPKAAYEGKLAKSVLAAGKAEQNVYKVASLLTNRQEGMPQITQGEFSDKAWIGGHQLYQQGKLTKLQTETAKVRLTKEGQAEQISRIGTRIKVNQDSIKNLLASKKGGASKIEQGIQMVKTLNLLPNGYTGEVIQSPDGKLQFKWSNSAGEEGVTDINDSNIDDFLNNGWGMIKPFIKQDPSQTDADFLQKQFELGAKDDLWRQNTNIDVTSKAISNTDTAYRDKDGKIFYLVHGLIEPTTGTQYPPSFVTGVNSKVVIQAGSDKARKLGLRPWKELTAELSHRDKESLIAQRKKVTEHLGKVTPKEQQASKAKLKAANTKHIRSLEKELRKQEAELIKQKAEGRNVLIDGKAEPIYEATKHSVQELKDKIAELKGTKKAGAKEPATEMPPAEQHEGKIIRDTENNKRYKSDGTQWIEID